jgi:hypothetical protein
VRGHLVQCSLAVVTERRVAEVVRQAGGVDDVRVAAERGGQLAADLGHLEAVREPVADEVVGVRADYLGLRGEPAQHRTVQHPCPVPGERRPPGTLGRLRHPPLGVMLVIPGAHKRPD